MRKVLAPALIVIGLGAAALAGPLSGTAEVCAKFDETDLVAFDSVIDLDYTVSSLTLGVTAVFELDEFDKLFFTAAGALGTIEFRSMLDFDRQTKEFMAWTNAASISLGGATLFGLFVVELVDVGWPIPTEGIGVGATLGMIGTFGDVSVTATSSFNMLVENALLFHLYGYDFMVAFDAFKACGEWYTSLVLPYEVTDIGCDLVWSGALIAADFPFACLDATVLTFVGDEGFGSFLLWLKDVEIGIPWLVLAGLYVGFYVDEKDVDLHFDLVFGDFVCVTPYVSLDTQAEQQIEGITLNALLLEYSYNGVTIKAGEIFDKSWPIDVGGFAWGWEQWGFTLDGGLAPRGFLWPTDPCVYEIDYDEFFGVWIDGDSCCGGAYDVGIITFFDTSQTGQPFDWSETVTSFEIGVGTNVTIGLSMSLMADGLQWFQICGEFSF